MSIIRRTLTVAVIALCGASVASAQTPALRPAPIAQTTVQAVPTAAPIPAMQLQQQQMWQNAFLQAKLWQMYQPKVVVVNTNPWVNYNTNSWGSYNEWSPYSTTTGSLWNSSNTFYRNNSLTWGNRPGLVRPRR